MTDSIQPYTFTEVNSDWHDTQTVQLGELMEQGFDPFAHPSWAEAGWYDEATRERIENKMTLKYKYYEIAITPPGKWRDMLTARALEVVPKYTPFYKALADGASIAVESDTWVKNRNVFSDFPATQLNPALEDYAANATDYESERVAQGDILDRLNRLENYRDIDARLVTEFHILFNQLATPVVRW